MADIKKRKKKKKKREKAFITQRYNKERIHEEREYGIYWYSVVWSILRPILIFLCSAIIVIGVLTTAGTKLYDRFLGPAKPYDGEIVEFTIENGTSISTIGENLENAGLLRNHSVFKYAVQLQGLGDSLTYGTYRLSPNMSTFEIISVLTGEGKASRERVITIIPGWTCENIADYLVQEELITSRDEFLALCNNADLFAGSSYALTAAEKSGTLPQRKYALEGYLAPDTYRVFANSSVESIIGTLLDQHNTLIDDVYYGDNTQYTANEDGSFTEVRGAGSDMSMDDVIIMASIIEKEAANPTDYARVSAVFHNRLSLGWKLESDPTATYLSGENKLILTAAEMADPNPYNTYANSGLPIGPICNPSRAALYAAMNPDVEYINNKIMYFCAGEPGTGTLVFAKTLEEHAANIAKYRPQWEAYDATHAGQ